MVLVEHDAVNADLFGEPVFGEAVAVELGASFGVEVGVGEEQGGDALLGGVFVVGGHGLFGEVHQVHGGLLTAPVGALWVV